MLQVVILLLIFLDILLEKQRIWESLLIAINSVIEMYGEITLPQKWKMEKWNMLLFSLRGSGKSTS